MKWYSKLALYILSIRWLLYWLFYNGYL